MRGWIAVAVALALVAGVASSCSEVTPSIDRVLVAGNDLSVQVRQGAGPVSIEVIGQGLQWVESAHLEDLPVTLRQGPTDGGVTVDTVITHGLAPGPRGLTLNLSGGRPGLSRAGVIDVTTINASAAGDDATGRGTRQLPYRTLTKALALAAPGDQVDLGPGTYSLASGEQWMPERNTPPEYDDDNVPDGVTLKGAGSAVTLLDGTGAADTHAALVFGGGALVEGLAIRNFHRGLVVARGVVNTTDVSITGCFGEGAIAFNAATLRLNRAEVNGCAIGVHAINQAALDITSSNVTGNGVGVQYAGSSRGSITSSACSNNDGAGVVAATSASEILLDQVTVDQNGNALGAVAAGSGVYAPGTSRLTLRSGTLSRNRGSGLWAFGGNLSFTNITAADNGLDGVTLDGVSQAVMGRTHLLRNGGDGLRATAAGAVGTPIVDITESTLRNNAGSGATLGAGTTTFRASGIDSNVAHGVRVLGRAAVALPWDPVNDAQANQISVAAPLTANACISDERVASSGSTISVVHATLQGNIVPSGPVQGPFDGRPQFRIVNANNQINFLQ